MSAPLRGMLRSWVWGVGVTFVYDRAGTYNGRTFPKIGAHRKRATCVVFSFTVFGLTIVRLCVVSCSKNNERGFFPPRNVIHLYVCEGM